jgi:small subunit ribosomal protein S20
VLKEVSGLANIKSALKRIKVTKFKTRRNKMIISSLRTSIRKYEDSIKAGDLTIAKANYQKVTSLIDKAVAKGTIHKNTAARKKSRLSKKLNVAI